MDTINSMKKTLGERIREQRILMQMTQEELAEELCVKKSTISMYENDKVDIITLPVPFAAPSKPEKR